MFTYYTLEHLLSHQKFTYNCIGFLQVPESVKKVKALEFEKIIQNEFKTSVLYNFLVSLRMFSEGILRNKNYQLKF